MRRLDLIRCVLVSDGINTILYTNDPVNGTTSVGAASGVNLTGIPMLLKLGTNHDETAWGRGHFFNVNQYDAVLTAVQVDDVFSKVGAGFNTSGIIVNETVKDGMAATAVIVNGMKATAISKDVWTDAKAAFVNASIAAIEPGIDDATIQAAAAAALGVFDGNFLSAAQKLQLTSAAKAENVDTLTKAAGAGDLAIVKTTVETIEALTGGAVADDRVKTIKCQDTTGSSIVGALVYSSSDALMRALIRGPFTSNAQGIATCLFPLGHQYIWIVATGYDIDNPLEITVT
jgi:hypothetical protein